jgi:hypothetical protein
MNGHPSSLQLERFWVVDLPPDAQEKTRAHVRDCVECRRSLEELEHAREEFLRTLPAEKVLANLAGRRGQLRSKRVLMGVGALTALAAGLALAVLVPRADRVQLKGLGASVYCKRGDQVRLLAPGEKIRAGDGLRVVLTLATRQPAAAWFLDARGRVDRFLTGGSSVLDPGEHALPGAVVESPCVDLWLILATGSDATQRLEAQFERARREGIVPGEGWAPAGALVRALRCE